MFELIPSGTNIDFIGRRRIAAVFSIALMLAGVAALPIQGFRMGIDFAGGTEMQVLFSEQVGGEGEIRDVLVRLKDEARRPFFCGVILLSCWS